MTTPDTPPDIPLDRRQSDAHLERIETAINEMCDSLLAAHVQEMHPPMNGPELVAHIMDRDERLVNTESVLDRVVKILEGKPKVSTLTGKPIDGHEPGMMHMVSQIYERTNGGVRVTYRPVLDSRVKAAIWTGALGLIGTFVLAAVSVLG